MNNNLQKNKKLFALLFLIGFLFPMLSYAVKNELLIDNDINNDNDDIKKINDLNGNLEKSASDTENLSTGKIENRDGKIFTDIQTSHSNCYVNGKKPSLSDQPDIYIPNWNITHANMQFENIKAINYTRDIETQYTDFIFSHESEPLYYFQKFSVEISQYVNNVSIYIQDIFDSDNFTDSNSWEVAIVNCSDDPNGIPNSNEDEIIGSVKKPHPIILGAHWELFDFKNSESGPVFLNTSQTKNTTENGVEKFWFAFRIKIPQDDTKYGGGPKFVYFNPDGSESIGEGDTYAISPDFLNDIYTNNDVNFTEIHEGNIEQGDLNSFESIDENRFTVKNGSDGLDYESNFTISFELSNLTQTDLNYTELLWYSQHYPFEWFNNHFYLLYSVNINLMMNVSNEDVIENSEIYLLNHTSGNWDPVGYIFDIDNETEYLQEMELRDPNSKKDFLYYVDAKDNNSVFFRFCYNTTGIDDLDVSFDKLNIEIGELEPIDTIQKYDPLIQDLHYANNVSVSGDNNGTLLSSESTALFDLKENDDKNLIAQAKGDNMTIEFKFNLLPDEDLTTWKAVDVYDWLFTVPYPKLLQVDVRVSSNTTLNESKSAEVRYAQLEVYKGDNQYDILSDRQNELNWLPFTLPRQYLYENETTKVSSLSPYYTWLLVQFANDSDNNSFKMRLRYELYDYSDQEQFNVSIDEFKLNFYVQNSISSDIASKIGLGLNNNKLTPSSIKMKNFGVNIDDNGNQKGQWIGNVPNGVPDQGSFEFEISSIWPYITFDASGTYTIEQSYSMDWEYEVSENNERAIWYVGADLTYFNGYTVVDDSKGMEVIVPSDWKSMEVYNFTDPPPYNSSKNGDWYWTNSSSGVTQTIKVYNIGEGLWKIKLNSSKSQISVSYDTSDSVKINKTITNNALIHDHYGGTFEFEVYNNETKLVYSAASSNLNGTNFENSTSFQWNIFDTTKKPGTYYMKTSWVISNSTHAFVASETTSIKIEQFNINLELLNLERYRNNSIYGTEILIGAKATVNETGDPITAEKINIEIYDEDDDLIEELSDITNENGRIELSYILPEGYQSIKIKLTYTTEGTYFASTESKQSINIKLISQGQSIVNTFITLSPYIIIGIAAVSTYVVLRQRRLNKLRAIWAKDAQILDDLLRISHIMIIHKEAGVVIYDKKVAIEEIDSDLIGGFLQAISSFRQEIRKDIDIDKGTKGFEMDYYDFKIVITDGDYIRVALILDGTPSESLKERQVEFTKAFENKFGKVLQEFDGEIKTYRAADKLIEDHFYISLAYPLKLSEHWEIIDLEPLEKDLVEVAQQIEAEKSFFFVSNLLSYGLAGRSESRNQIISAIISLSDKEVLEPIKMEA